MNIWTKRRKRNFGEFLHSLVFFLLVIFTPTVLVGFFAWNFFSSLSNSATGSVVNNFPKSTTGEAPSISWLSTKGSSIINESGEEVVLRGVNIADLGWVGYEEWTPGAIEVAVRDWKANVVRVRIYEERFFADSDGYMSRLETEVISPAKQLGVYVILHPFLKDRVPLPTRRTSEMWQMIAKRYKDSPEVLYDPLDEPHDVTMDQVRAAYSSLIPVIREANPKSLIFVTGLEWGRIINSYVLNPLPYTNIVYRTNIYDEESKFAGAFEQAIGVLPVFIGEFGADGYPPMSKEAVSSLLALAKTYKIGWTAWTFHSVGCPCLLTDFKKFTVSPYGEIVRDFLLGSR